ncbi:MAG TPA: helix-turn-helix domain-containing protein [Roseateles sp.]|uniref:TetR/AcrR family transcriptional regulator n=1 Tax=Roseateles sp. TaxID=1971397 RepID=UPI002ED7E49F
MTTRTPPPAAVAKPRVRRGPAEMAQLKLKLLELARGIHDAEGPAALSMRRLAQDAGLSTMALYSYFPNKQALLEGLWLEVFEALLAELLAASMGRRAPLKVMEGHLRSFLAFWEARPEQFRMIYMSTPQGDGKEAVPMKDQPVYRQLIQLERERVAACAGTTEPSEVRLAEASALSLIKLVGYLLVVLGMPRYPLPERMQLRERVIADSLHGIVKTLAS